MRHASAAVSAAKTARCNDAWSCPLPPRENWLGVPIKAGEQTFPHD